MSAPAEVTAYTLPAWDCPDCGEVNVVFGQDDASGEQECISCGRTVEVVS